MQERVWTYWFDHLGTDSAYLTIFEEAKLEQREIRDIDTIEGIDGIEYHDVAKNHECKAMTIYLKDGATPDTIVDVMERNAILYSGADGEGPRPRPSNKALFCNLSELEEEGGFDFEVEDNTYVIVDERAPKMDLSKAMPSLHAKLMEKGRRIHKNVYVIPDNSILSGAEEDFYIIETIC